MKTIDATKLDPRFKHRVASHPGGENINLCYACGTCTASCPVSNIDDEYSPRKIIRQVLLGMREDVLSSPVIWRCVLCYACYATCPQNVKFRDVMKALREIATAEGFARPTLTAEAADMDRQVQTLRRDMVNLLVSNPDRYATLMAEIQGVLGTAKSGVVAPEGAKRAGA